QGRSEAGFGGSEKASPRIGAMSRPADSFADLFRGKARFSNPYGVDLRMYIFRLFFPPQQASRFRRGKLKGALPLQPGEEIAEGVLDVGACPPLKPFILDRSGPPPRPLAEAAQEEHPTHVQRMLLLQGQSILTGGFGIPFQVHHKEAEGLMGADGA